MSDDVQRALVRRADTLSDTAEQHLKNQSLPNQPFDWCRWSRQSRERPRDVSRSLSIRTCLTQDLL
jgi:hypothetical protein